MVSHGICANITFKEIRGLAAGGKLSALRTIFIAAACRDRARRLVCDCALIFPVVACTRTKSQGLTQSPSNPKLITHLADFSVQEVNFEHIF